MSSEEKEPSAPAPAHEAIASLADELADGSRSTLAWALVHASQGDPIPEAWARCNDPIAMVMLLERARVQELTVAFDRMTKHAHTYPHARECFSSAAQDLRWGRRGVSARWVRDALIHFPGRGTAQPRPERAEALRASLCGVLREQVPVIALGDFSG